MLIKHLYISFIYYFLLFGLISIPNIVLDIEPSLEYLRILFFSIISMIGIFLFKKKNMNHYINKLYFYNLIFLLYIILSMFWSPSIVDSLRYINKVIFAFTFPYLIIFLDVKKEKMVKLLLYGFWAIFILTIIGEQFRNIILPNKINDIRFQGLLSVHTTKFVIGTISIFFFSYFLFFKNKKYLLLSVIGMIIIILTLQRATIFSVIGGFWAIYIIYNIINQKTSLTKMIFLSAMLIFILVLILFFFEPIVNRSFSSITNRDDALFYLKKGHFLEAYKYFLDKGRERIWQVATERQSYIFGAGFGSVSYLIKDSLGIFTEAHNDYVKIFVEVGVVGSILFLLNIYNIFKLDIYLIKNTKKDEKMNLVLLSSSIAILFFCMIVAFFDNLLDHSHHSIIFALIFLFIAIKRPQKITSKKIKLK